MLRTPSGCNPPLRTARVVQVMALMAAMQLLLHADRALARRDDDDDDDDDGLETWVIIVIVIAVVAVLIIIGVIVACCILRCRREDKKKENANMEHKRQLQLAHARALAPQQVPVEVMDGGNYNNNRSDAEGVGHPRGGVSVNIATSSEAPAEVLREVAGVPIQNIVGAGVAVSLDRDGNVIPLASAPNSKKDVPQIVCLESGNPVKPNPPRGTPSDNPAAKLQYGSGGGGYVPRECDPSVFKAGMDGAEKDMAKKKNHAINSNALQPYPSDVQQPAPLYSSSSSSDRMGAVNPLPHASDNQFAAFPSK